MKFWKVAASVMIAFTLMSCSAQRKQARAFEKLLEAETGQKFKIQKLNTERPGSTVFKNKSTGEYVAYNLNKFNRETMTKLSDFTAIATAPGDIVRNLTQRTETYSNDYWVEGYWATDYDPIYDEDGNYIGSVEDEYYVEGYWATETWSVTYYDGSGFTFSARTDTSKDLDAIAADIEEGDRFSVAQEISTRFGLSEERADTLANLAINYQKLEDARKLTAADKEIFSRQALSVSFRDLQTAYKNKETIDGKKSLGRLMHEAAQANGTTPEKMRAIVDMYFGQGN